MVDEKLDDLRSKIDDLDLRILDLLNQRMTLSLEIGSLKAAEKQNAVDRVREEEIIRRLAEHNAGPILHETLVAVYQEIFSGSRALQTSLTIAYLGPPGTHTHEAALKRFGNSHLFSSCSSVKEVFDEVDRATADFGVVPVENSIEGSVRETLDSLMTSRIGICGEISLRIRHALMNLSGKTEDIRLVVSHPQALAQCRQWLNRRLPEIPVQETSSTAKAAEMTLRDSGTAAVANESVAKRLGLHIISGDIQDMPENFTRFLVLGALKSAATGRDRTSIVFWTEDRPGALFNILEAFARHNINLSRIESRPDRGTVPWKYAFFVDLEGHQDEPRVATCLKEIEGLRTMVKILGSFPVQAL
ncbi:MAG TPA: prephenate dehydratase [Desulfomonilaceae bacterium]|nr:prephenate dehydratase [Desulfomonilaceae bacterium]